MASKPAGFRAISPLVVTIGYALVMEVESGDYIGLSSKFSLTCCCLDVFVLPFKCRLNEKIFVELDAFIFRNCNKIGPLKEAYGISI